MFSSIQYSLFFFLLLLCNQSMAAPKRMSILSIGDSIAAYPGSSYSAILSKVCSKAEFYSYAIPRKNPNAVLNSLKKDFGQQKRFHTLRTRDVKWMIIQGGINSIENPVFTMKSLLATHKFATLNNFRVISLSLTPWGGRNDVRWQGDNAFLTMAATMQVVDFALRTKSPRQLGLSKAATWSKAFLPDIVVDLFYDGLRDYQAPLWETDTIEQNLGKAHFFNRLIAGIPKFQARKRFRDLVSAYAKFPRFFLDERYRSFDHIHINKIGHEVIAEKICSKVFDEWGCDCQSISESKKSNSKLIDLVQDTKNID